MDHRQLKQSTSRTSIDSRAVVCRRLVRAVGIALVFVGGQFAPALLAEPPAAPPPHPDGPVQYVGPDTYILLDAEGHPQPMLGMRYEDFVSAWKESQHLQSTATEPRFVIEKIDFTGQVRGDRAELT